MSAPGEGVVHADPVEDPVRAPMLALLAGWPLILAMALAGLAAGLAGSYLSKPVYASRVTFFVSAAGTGASNALQADQFVQRRINSYVGVVNSDRMASRIAAELNLDLPLERISSMLVATADADTVLLKVEVRDTDRERGIRIADSVGRNLNSVIGALDSNGNNNTRVDLNVISGPTLDAAPISPVWSLNIGLGLLFGLAAGVVTAMLRAQLDTTVRTGEQLRLVGVPNLAVLSSDKVGRNGSTMMGVDEVNSRRAEAYRQLRTNLRFVDAAKPVHVLVVTSSVEAEGKTTVASNLALAFARARVRTLLVDADLRHPRVGSLFGLEDSVGLTTILVGDASLEDVVQPAGVEGLDVIPSGPTPPNPSELLGSPAMQELVMHARESYEMVIIDTPPVTPVTDGVVTSLLADGVVFVVRYGRTARSRVHRAIQSLDSVGVRTVGTILTMVPARADPGVDTSSYYAVRESTPG